MARNWIPLVPSGTINADASVAQLEQDVLAMDSKVGELAEDIGDTEQEINQLKSQIDDLEDVNLREVEIHFQRGAFAADGSFEYSSTKYASVPSTVFGIDYIEVQGTYTASLLMFDGDTYLGKIRPDMTLDKAAGNWKAFSGKVNMRELMDKFSANGFRITISAGATIGTYETAYNTKYCKFYSYTEPSSEISEVIQIENGTYSKTNQTSFNMTFEASRIRTHDLIKVRAGDVLEVFNDGGKYNSYYTAWNGLPGTGGGTRTTDSTFGDGTRLRFALDTYVLIIFSVAGSTSTPIAPSEFTGKVILHRYSQANTVIEDNAESLKQAIGSQRNFTGTWTSNVPANNLASFVHVTDVHGDRATFANAYEVAKYINADAIINSGDTVFYYSSDSIDFVTDAVADKRTDLLMCMGNHDGFAYTAEQQNTKFIAPFATDYGYQLPEGVSNPTYYYKDYASRNLRVLVVNQFEYDGQTSSTDTRFCMTQDQADFIVATLAATPQDYGVVIVMHAPEKAPVADNNYKKFYQPTRLATDTFPNILTEIVDAFQSGTTFSETFENPSGATPASVTVSADFTELNSGVEFIAFICGHYHADQISYVPSTTNKQLLLNAVTTNSWYGIGKIGINGSNNPYLTEGSDLQRISGTPTQDAFNVYTIDRTNKTVRVVRIGANMPADMETVRDYMVIPYADN